MTSIGSAGTAPARRRDPLEAPSGVVPRAVSGVVGLLLVAAFGLLVAGPGRTDAAELKVLQWLSEHHASPLVGFSQGIQWIFEPSRAILLSLVIAAVAFVLTRDLLRSGTFLLVIAVSWGSSDVLKHVVGRVRPDVTLLADPPALEHSYSFPSGHSCFAAALVIGLLVLTRATRARPWILGTGALFVAVVIVSRLYLGAHYPTDVLGALVYAVSAALLVIPLWMRYAVPPLGKAMPWCRTRGLVSGSAHRA